jgi:hypothetical protein
VKQIQHKELEDGDKERPSAFSKIMLKQTDSGIQQLHGAGERTPLYPLPSLRKRPRAGKDGRRSTHYNPSKRCPIFG